MQLNCIKPALFIFLAAFLLPLNPVGTNATVIVHGLAAGVYPVRLQTADQARTGWCRSSFAKAGTVLAGAAPSFYKILKISNLLISYPACYPLFPGAMKKYLLMLVLLPVLVAHAQDGKILSQQPVAYPDTVRAERIRYTPRFAEVFAQTEAQVITYRSGGLKIQGYVVQPKQPGTYPCVVYCRGGHEDFGQLDLWTVSALADIAHHGYVVIASQLRGTPGSGGKDEFGGADTLDVINCLSALSHFSKADTSRIGLYGISRGGLNALQVLRSQRRIRAAVINSGAVDAFENLKRKDGAGFEQEVYNRLIPKYKKDKQKQLELRSPVRWAARLCPTTPLLIMQGSADWRTPAGPALELVRELYELKRPVRFALVEGGTHGLRGVPLRDYLLYDWLDRYVRDRAPLPNLEPHGE